MRVPTTQQVLPGAQVNIVLKADQPTGRTVSGKIQDVLTRGNHPRGIKVRLSDGRIGRVQSMLSSSSSSQPPPEDSNYSPFGPDASEDAGQQSYFDPSQDGGRFSSNIPAGAGRGYARPRQTDRVRGQEDGPERQVVGLDAYIKPAKNKRGRKRGGGSAANVGAGNDGDVISSTTSDTIPGYGVEAETATSTCPVCGDFEGDAAAVAHHVAGHFGD